MILTRLNLRNLEVVGKWVNLKAEVTRKQRMPNFPKNKHFLTPDTHTYAYDQVISYSMVETRVSSGSHHKLRLIIWHINYYLLDSLRATTWTVYLKILL